MAFKILDNFFKVIPKKTILKNWVKLGPKEEISPFNTEESEESSLDCGKQEGEGMLFGNTTERREERILHLSETEIEKDEPSDLVP